MTLRLLMIVTVMAGTVQGTLVDINKEVVNILKKHNKERSNRVLKASNMLEMTWDKDLAKTAGDFAEKCSYVHPNAGEYNLGSNLHYEMDFVKGPKSIHRLVNNAIKSWSRSKGSFVYSTDCERACTYVQMIQGQTNKIGCAINTCQTLNEENKPASLFVCFYSPRQAVRESFPFRTGYSCSECPNGSICRDGLCSNPTTSVYEALPSYVDDSPSDRSPSQRQAGAAGVTGANELTDNEEYYIQATHNRLRESNDQKPLEWDPYLEKWAQWIIHCDIDYPGPRHTFTNFHRLDQGAFVYAVVYEWSTEGRNTNIQLDHGCRTARDLGSCNHNTNVLQVGITSMACVAKDCKDNTRQLVCLYDNKEDRPKIIAPAKPTTYRPFIRQ